jgi:hypothetical protein
VLRSAVGARVGFEAGPGVLEGVRWPEPLPISHHDPQERLGARERRIVAQGDDVSLSSSWCQAQKGTSALGTDAGTGRQSVRGPLDARSVGAEGTGLILRCPGRRHRRRTPRVAGQARSGDFPEGRATPRSGRRPGRGHRGCPPRCRSRPAGRVRIGHRRGPGRTASGSWVMPLLPVKSRSAPGFRP